MEEIFSKEIDFLRQAQNSNIEIYSGESKIKQAMKMMLVRALHLETANLRRLIQSGEISMSYDIVVAVVEAFFFGLATFLVIRQAQNGWLKFVYAGFEGVAIFLYYNSPYFGEWANFALTSYISIFAAFTFYSLGYISLHRYKEQLKEITREAKRQAIQESKVILDKAGEPYKTVIQKPGIGFQASASKPSAPISEQASRDEQVMSLINQGYSYSEIEAKIGVPKATVSRIKNRNTL